MINPDICHEIMVKNTKQILAFDKSANFEEYRAQLKAKFIELTGLDIIAQNACEPELKIVSEEERENCKIIRFEFFSEVGETVPCYLCIPKTGKKKYPVAITMQGHSTGFHNSIGIKKYERDEAYHPRGQFALQAVEHGYIALAIEQRGMGERNSPNPMRSFDRPCQWHASVALSLGRTLLGERMWDIMRAIDMLANFPECDMDKILITGNSGGGTISYYTACVDDRIKLSAPSCAFCSYEKSILDVLHCFCNFIPGSYRYFEMQDLSALIAPKNLMVIAGEKDPIFPIDGVKEGFETVKAVYEKAGAEDKCSLVVTPKEHWWCVDIVWNAIDEETKKMGW